MIRNNKHLTPKIDSQSPITINYRNAVYQGCYNQQKQQRQGRGIIYLSENHHFIACNKFIQNKINDLVLFYASHSRYHYGYWHNHQPNGLAVFRMNEILIITQYKQGKILAGTKAIFIFEKYCMGITLQFSEEMKWSAKSKYEVYGLDKIQEIMYQCAYDSNKLSPSLIKILNSQFSNHQANSFKLRLIKNQYYRFGFDTGLAISFDDEFQLLSAGEHNRNDLEGVGIKFSEDRGDYIQEGIFSDNTYTFQKSNKPTYKLGQMYLRHHLSSPNFKNQYIKDPSEAYFQQFQLLMKHNIFEQMFNQFLSSSSFEASNFGLFLTKNQNEPSKKVYQKLQFEEMEMPSFKKAFKQLSKLSQRKLNDEQQSRVKKQNNSFERLSQKNRLEIMKKELINTIIPKQFPAKLNSSRQKDKKSIRSQRQQPIKTISNHNIEVRQLKDSSSKLSQSKVIFNQNANLDQKIDIVIKQPPPQKESISKSRSKKKKIFQLTKSIKRDYSPQRQVSPFKFRMKARIFGQSYSRSRSKSNNKIKKQKTLKGSKSGAGILPDDKIHREDLKYSAIKSIQSSRMANLPITMAKDGRIHSSKQIQDILAEQSSNLKTIKQKKINAQQILRFQQEQHNKIKRNQVYRNPMIKGGYSQYVYQPINIRQTGNSPYTKNPSMKSLTRNHSNNQISESFYEGGGKKMIGQSTPLKKHKMSGYLNYQQPKTNQKYSAYKKRTGYF